MKARFSFFFILLFVTVFASAQRIGSSSPEIGLKSPQGETITVSSLKGKVVLIDFWASWCGPCRRANPGMRKIYEKYKAKGFEVYGISLDKYKQPWTAAIKADKITWTQVWDENGEVANKWGINYIPQSFLLDKTGKIIATELEGKELEEQIKKLL